MDAYLTTMDAVGDSIIKFVDPNNEFTGYTDVSCGKENNDVCEKDIWKIFKFFFRKRSWKGLGIFAFIMHVNVYNLQADKQWEETCLKWVHD